MKLNNAQYVLKRLGECDGFVQDFPDLIQNIQNDKLLVYDNYGEVRTLSEHQEKMVQEIEEFGKEFELNVYAIISALTSGCYMNSYLYVTNEDEDISQSLDGDYYYAIACVENTSWDITEHGSILLEPGTMRRIG